MLEILREHLDKTADPLFINNIDEAHALFDSFELRDYTLEFEELLSTADNSEISNLNDNINELTRVLQNQILNTHLIFANEDCQVHNLNLLLKSIQQLESTEFTNEVLSICENEEDPTDAFVETVALVMGLSAEDVVTYVERVEPSLIKKIIELMNTRSHVENMNVVDHTTIQSVLARYNEFCNIITMDDAPLVSGYIEEGGQLGTEFKVYCQYIRERLTSKLPSDIAGEYIAAAILAGDVTTSPREIIQSTINEVYSDIDIITPILISVDKLLLDLEIRLNAGIKKVS